MAVPKSANHPKEYDQIKDYDLSFLPRIDSKLQKAKMYATNLQKLQLIVHNKENEGLA